MKLRQHTKAIVQLLFLLLFCAPMIEAQNTVDQTFTKSTTQKISLNDKNLSSKSTQFNQSIDLGEYGVYDLSLEQTYLFSDAYIARKANKNNDEKLPLTFKGTIQGQPNTLVSLTTNKGFLSGFIDTGEEVIFFEPYKNFDSDAQKNELIIYYQKDVIDKGHTCVANHTDEQTTQIKPKNDQFKSAAAGCYEVEMVLVAGYGMYQKHGASTLNHITSVLNNVKANYDNEFNDPITFVVVDDYIAKTSGQNLWSSTLFAPTLLNEFRDSDFTNVTYDLASLWVTRDIWNNDDNGVRNDNVVGLAKRPGVCGSRYNLIEDFSSSSAKLRAAFAHEIGHNFSAEHDAEGSSTIMAPSVNVTNTWSTKSKNAINAFYPTATCLCASGDAADLAFRSCGTSNSSGNTLTISGVEVKNNGTISADAVKVGWYLSTDNNITTSDYLIGTRNTPILQVNYYITLGLTANLANIPPGNYYLGTIIDYEDSLVEFSEDNNIGCISSSANITITVTQPDLQISACGASFSSGTTRFYNNVIVSNSGTTTSGTATLGVYLSSNNTVNTSDYRVATASIPALSGGTTSSHNLSFNTATVTGVPAGNYYVGLIADSGNTVTESNENNNVSCVSSSASITIEDQTEPDIIISAKSVNSTNVACGSSISASATVKNNGDASTGEGSYMGYYLSTNTTLGASDTYLTNDYVGTLAPNAISSESAVLNIPAATAAGNYYILFVADYQKVITESNENNNVAYQAITVTCVAPKPDLIISVKSLNSTNVACGNSVSASATVKNNGDASTGRYSYLGYYLSSNTTLDATDALLAADYVTTLGANATSNQSAVLNIPAATAAGNYYILFAADYQKVITESNENNNVAYQAITVTCGTNCQYTDSLALVDVFNALNGNTWRASIRWDLTKPMDTWYGVTLNQNKCVDKLAIFEEDFGGTLSPSICNLSEITYIDLSENQISGTIPANIGNLTNLTFLSLDINKLTNGVPTSIGNLINLTNLYLNSNQLTSVPASIGDLSNLESLILSGNELTNVPASIGNLGNLKRLYLHSNLLTNIPSTIGDLSNLTALAVNDNQLVNIPASIGNLSKLNFLQLSGNQLTALPASIGNLAELSRFYLSKNQLTYLPTSIGNLSKLAFLYLEDNLLTALPVNMGNLNKLRTLWVQRNQIAGAMPEWFADLENLTSLITYNNQLSGCYSDKLATLCTQLSTSYNRNTYISNGNNFTIPWEDFCNGTTCTSDLCGDDNNTLLHLPFDYSRNGTGGETPTASQYVSLGDGKYSNGANIIEYSDTPTLKYKAANNINSQQGTVEAWVKPTWNGNDGKGHTILQYGAEGGILILKNGANNLRLIINRFSPSGYPEQGVGHNISDWQANQWRHIAFTWGGGQLRLYIDGNLTVQQPIYSTPLFPISDTEFNIGTDAGWNVWQGTIDHLRISNVVRSRGRILEFMYNCEGDKIEQEGYTLETHSYPNPFTDHATIMYTLPKESPVTLNVYNSEGKQVASLYNNEIKTAGTHTTAFEANALPAGMYYYTIEAGEYFGTQKMILMK